MRPCLRNRGTRLSVPAGRLIEVVQGKLGHGPAHLEPVAQAAEPGIHASAAHPIGQCLLTVARTHDRTGETDRGQQAPPFGIIKAPQAGVTRHQGTDAGRVRLDVPCRGQARVQVAP